MGLFDIFKRKDTAKESFRVEVGKAVSSGKLTPDKLKHLERLQQELGVESPSQDHTMVRRQQYQAAAGAVIARGKLSPAEEKELRQIQTFLGLKDLQIAEDKADLARLRILTEMRGGKFPVISPENVVMRGLRIDPKETPYWAEVVEMYETTDLAGGSVGLRLTSNVTYQVGSVSSYTLPIKSAQLKGDGNLIFTSQRMILKGGARNVDYAYDVPEEFALYQDGLRLKLSNNRQVLFKFRSHENADFVGIILSKNRSDKPQLFGQDSRFLTSY